MRVIIAVPAHNEEALLEASITRLTDYVKNHLPDDSVQVVVAENGSTDNTLSLANYIAKENPIVTVVSTNLPGKGRTLKKAWELEADIFIYIDADLPYELTIIKKMIGEIKNGADIAVASRWILGASNSQVPIRQFSSRLYNKFLRFLFKTHLNDFQAGAKALNKKARDLLVPLNNEMGWFFDTLLLLEAERTGLRVKEIPAVCVDTRNRLPALRGLIYFIQKPLALRTRRWFPNI